MKRTARAIVATGWVVLLFGLFASTAMVYGAATRGADYILSAVTYLIVAAMGGTIRWMGRDLLEQLRWRPLTDEPGRVVFRGSLEDAP